MVSPRRPNFLLFVTDQQRADHLGCMGEPVLTTPAIDGIAAAGCVFDNFHVATPICQPNRASLMTGRLPSVHGLTMNGRELSHRETTFVELLRRAGWRTALAGKAHLQNISDTPPAWPAAGEPRLDEEAARVFPGRHGQELWHRWNDDPAFDLDLPYYGFEQVQLAIGHADQQHGHWRRWLRAQHPQAERWIGPDNAIPAPEYELTRCRQAWRTRLPEELHPTRWVAERCNELLAGFARADDPFFIQCSFPDPHHPFTPPGRWWGRYAPDDIVLPPAFAAGLHDPPPPVTTLHAAARDGRARKGGHAAFACSEREAREAIALNHGNVAFIDDAIGSVLAQLDRLGLADDTVVLFTSDHGDLLGDRGLLLKGGLHYRALTRVAMVWRDTAGRRDPRRTDALAQTIDIGPTVLARAGVAPANGMQGQSLLPLIDGRTNTLRDAIVIEEEGQRRDFGLAQRTRMRSLLTQRHRLTLWAGAGFGELYDLENDPHELHNLWHAPGARPLRGELAEALALRMVENTDTSPYPSASA